MEVISHMEEGDEDSEKEERHICVQKYPLHVVKLLLREPCRWGGGHTHQLAEATPT